MIEPREFRNALGRFATGVSIVTMCEGDATHGLTVNAFMSASLAPPLVAIGIDRQANAHQTLLAGDRYGVSILRNDQESLSDHFAGRPTPGVEEPFVEVDGFPLLKGALVHLICRIVAAHETGDHTLFVGCVEYLDYGEGAPLLYYAGQYARATEQKLSE